ncbi:unnamed protein product [Phyllotreta striolata]|uniref:Lysosomal Pro-X carboxypeptidase n=1 Tax=Phyllotreta striolata TaxID=444603 RepID=A0A9N9XSI2_PHYSR|nr:unnamed protein product [Phyllotreta striolata]
MFLLIFLLSTCFALKHQLLETRYIEVPLDHFSTVPNTTKFNLRYLMNSNYYRKNGPVFLFIGGQRDIMMSALNSGFLFDIAPYFNALLIFIEHRYYGKSLPFGGNVSTSPEYFRYLSVVQALQDYAYFIEELKKTLTRGANHPEEPNVVLFGSYYGGMLSTWMRMKYPFSVVGSVASSAPLFHFEGLIDCGRYLHEITTIFEAFGQKKCVKYIKLGWKVILHSSTSKQERNYLSEKFKLCRNIETAADVYKLLDWLKNMYVHMALFNYPYNTYYYKPLPANIIRLFCDKVVSGSSDHSTDLIQIISEAAGIYANYTGKTPCTNYDFNYNEAEETAWNYQTCTELVMPMCSTSKDMFMSKRWTHESYQEDCLEKFGVRPKPHWARVTFGGKNLMYQSNLLFSMGSLDPTSVGGVYFNKSRPSYPLLSYVIPETPHLMDFRSTRKSDVEYVSKARKFYVQVLKKWLKMYFT